MAIFFALIFLTGVTLIKIELCSSFKIDKMAYFGRPNKVGLENCGKPWADSELTQLLTEIKEKKTFDEIATAHKRTVGGVTSRLQYLAYNYYLKDKPINEISVIVGLSKDDIADAINRFEHRDNLKAEKEKKKEMSATMAKPKLTAKSETSELKEILAILKSIEIRVAEFIKERSIFDE
jgi:hypothetical protein